MAVKVDPDEARRVELVASDDVVASSASSTTSQVCRVASGAKDTRRFARVRIREVQMQGGNKTRGFSLMAESESCPKQYTRKFTTNLTTFSVHLAVEACPASLVLLQSPPAPLPYGQRPEFLIIPLLEVHWSALHRMGPVRFLNL